jgi:hypothetical protein
MQASNPYSPPVQILRRPAVVARTGLPTRSGVQKTRLLLSSHLEFLKFHR